MQHWAEIGLNSQIILICFGSFDFWGIPRKISVIVSFVKMLQVVGYASSIAKNISYCSCSVT